MPLFLRVQDLTGQHPTQDHFFDDARVTIGREAANRLCLTDTQQMISRRHATIQRGRTTEVVDLGSRNGTFLNEQRLAPHQPYPLTSGDHLRIGPYRLDVRLLGDDDTATGGTDAALMTQALTPALAQRYQLPTADAPREELHRAVEELHFLNELALEISIAQNTQDVMNRVVRRSVDALDAEDGVITLVGEGQTEGAEQALTTMVRTGTRLGLNQHLFPWMQDHVQPLLLNKPREHPAFRHVRWDGHLRNLVCVPLIVRSRLTGLLTVFNKRNAADFTPADPRLLSILAAQAAQFIQNAALLEEQRELQQVQRSLQVALDIQTNLLPKKAPAIPGYDVAGRSIAAQAVGGDHFDYIPMHDDQWALCVGDVSGKGLPAALVMANLQATLRAQTLWSDSVKACLEGANTLLYESTNARTFITLFYGVLDPHTHTFRYANAGHNHPLLVRDGAVKPLTQGGLVLAAVRSVPYTEHTLALASGDLLLIFSDGVVEARNARAELFGDDRLAALLQRHQDTPAAAVIDAVVEAVMAFAGDEPQADDITLLALRRTS